jgi:hypothetical protein
MGMKSSLARNLLKIPKFSQWVVRLNGQLTLLENERVSPFLLHNRLKMLAKELVLYDASSIGYIRLGDSGDGGYVMAECIRDDFGILSLGVGENVSFDAAISAMAHSIHLYDHTVDGLPSVVPNSTFFREGIGITSKNNFTTLEKAISRFDVSQDLILKMDIESSEWEILSRIDASHSSRFSQIIVEFHGLNNIPDEDFFKTVIATFQNLNFTHYLINIHVNNYEPVKMVGGFPLPNVIECTYLRKTEGRLNPIRNSHPHNLNMPNDKNRPEYISGFIY